MSLTEPDVDRPAGSPAGRGGLETTPPDARRRRFASLPATEFLASAPRNPNPLLAITPDHVTGRLIT